MIALVLFIVLGLLILGLFEWYFRQQRIQQQGEQEQASPQPTKETDSECCGEHLVCERETLLQTKAEVVYYDDEELDSLAGIAAEDLSREQELMIREVFHTLLEKDVPGWVRSLQLRNISLPADVREEALLIVRERRQR